MYPESPQKSGTVLDQNVADSLPVQAAPSFYGASSLQGDSTHDPSSQTLSSDSIPRQVGKSKFISFSKRQVVIVSGLIIFTVLLITGGLILFFAKGQIENSAVKSFLPSQEVDIGGAAGSISPPEITGEEQALLVSGDVITKGNLKVSSNGQVIILQPATLTADRTYTLPDSSGTICLNSNNCNYLTQVGLAGELSGLQAQIDQLGQLTVPSVPDIPASSFVNGQEGVVSIQGTSNRVSVNTTNGKIKLSTPQDLAIVSSPTFSSLLLSSNLTIGGILDLPLNCSALANGGALTTNASGHVVCSGDDGGASGSVSSPGGTAGVLAMFTAAHTIADSIVSQALGTVTVGGALQVTGGLSANSLTLTTPLTVGNGGTGVTSFTSNGVLLGSGSSAISTTTAPLNGQVLIGNGGVPGFVSISGDIAVTGAGVTTIQNNSVDLGADTTGNYVAGLTAGNGISVGGAAGEGWSPTVSASVQTNKGLEVDSNGLSLVDCALSEILKYNGSNQWACATDGAGSGVTAVGALDGQPKNATGATIASNTIYLQTADGTNPGLVSTGSQTFAGDKTFSGDVGVQGGTVTIGTIALAGNLLLHEGDGNTADFVIGAQSGNQTYTFVQGGTVVTSGNVASNAVTNVTAGNGLTGGGGPGSISLDIGAGNGISVAADSVALSLQASKGLEVDGNGLSLIDCSSGELLKYNGSNQWACATDTAGAGGVTGSGTNNRLTKFTSTGSTVGDSTITDDGSTVTTSVDLVIQGGLATIGTTSQTASIILHDGDGETITLNLPDVGTSYSLLMPGAVGSANQCLKDSDGAGTLVWADCLGGSGGGLTSIDGQTGPSVSINNATGSGNIITIDNAVADGATKGIAAFNGTNFSASSGVINTIQGISTSAAPQFAGLTLTGNLSVASNSIVTSGATISSAELDRLDGKDAALVDTNDAVNTAITGTGALTSGSIGSGFGTISTGSNITTTATATGGTVNASSGAVQTNGTDRITNSGGLTNITGYSQTSGNFAFSGAGNFSVDSSAFDVTSGGAVSGITGLTMASGNFLQSGTGTFGTGTGAVSLNGATTAGSTLDVVNSVAYRKGTDYSTTGTSNDVNFGEVSLVRLTGASAQTITGVSGGRDGEVLTIVNAAAQPATISNLSGSSSANNQITTGTGVDVSLAAGASITLVYDSTASLWRVLGGVAGGNGTCSGCANTSLSNLSTVAINTSLLTQADNSIDLGSSGSSWRTLYADTSVLTPSVDVASAGALSLGNSTATSISICNSAACDTITIGTNTDADTISVGDANDTINITGTNIAFTGSTGQLALSATGSSGGLVIGGDANLYRGSANVLNTDDNLWVGGDGTFGSDVLVSDGSTNQVEIGGTGLGSNAGLRFGSGLDTNLYRSAANTLMTDDALTIAGLLTGQAGSTISGGTINLNASSNNATNINTGSSTGAVSIGNSSAGAIALNSGAAITADTTAGISLDAATASNLTVTGSGQSLTLAAAGGGAQQVIMQSAGTGANALRLQASDTAGGIDIDSGTNGITLDSTGAISLDSTALTSNFNITANSASNATLTIGVSNAGAGTATLTLAADETINLNAPTIVGSATTLNLFNTTATTINVGGAVGSGGINFAGGSGSTGCTIDGSTGDLVCSGTITPGGSAPFVQNGSSFGAQAVLGTNDTNSLAFETDGTTKWVLGTNGHLIPNLDDTYDIGDNTHRVRDLFTGPGTIHVGTSTSDEGTISYNTTSNNLLFGATNGSLFQNGANSTTAFQIQNSAGTSNLFIADTTNTRVGIGVASPQYTLDVAGDINASGKVKEDGFDLVPAGSISMFVGTTAPSGWLIMDGQTCYEDVAYPDLESILDDSSNYATFYECDSGGGAGSGFIIPDTRGKNVIGYNSSDADFNAIGDSAGAKTHTLTQGQLPSYSLDIGPLTFTGGVTTSHFQNLGTAAGGANRLAFGSGGPVGVAGDIGGSLSSGGSGQSHNILDPYITFTYIVKY